MIQKMLLVRKVKSRADLLDECGAKSFVAGEPLKVRPSHMWSDQDGVSHYAFVLKDLTLDAFEMLEEYVGEHDGLTLIDHEGSVDETLASVGLQINKSAK